MSCLSRVTRLMSFLRGPVNYSLVRFRILSASFFQLKVILISLPKDERIRNVLFGRQLGRGERSLTCRALAWRK